MTTRCGRRVIPSALEQDQQSFVIRFNGVWRAGGSSMKAMFYPEEVGMIYLAYGSLAFRNATVLSQASSAASLLYTSGLSLSKNQCRVLG